MKILIVEDDFIGRTLIQEILSKYGACHTAVNGNEAVVAFQKALESGEPYELIILDIMMPGMDGRETLKCIRNREQEAGIMGLACTKIVMTTALDDKKNIIGSFRDQCDGYVVKPIIKEKLIAELKKLDLIE